MTTTPRKKNATGSRAKSGRKKKTAKRFRHTITIKLKPYLQEFLICKLGDEAAEASKNSLIGAMLSPLLEYAPNDYVYKQQKGDDFITFELPHWIGNKDIRNGTVYISEKNQIEFQRVLSNYFKDIFYQYVDDKIRYTGEIKKCILSFCADYYITFNNITYEMLKKAYYRRKKQANIRNIFNTKMSLSCPLIFLL